MGLEQRGRVRRLHERNNWKQEDLDASDQQTVPYHWQNGMVSACLPDGSRVRRESHARFCERPVVKFHRPTHRHPPGMRRARAHQAEAQSASQERRRQDRRRRMDKWAPGLGSLSGLPCRSSSTICPRWMRKSRLVAGLGYSGIVASERVMGMNLHTTRLVRLFRNGTAMDNPGGGWLIA